MLRTTKMIIPELNLFQLYTAEETGITKTTNPIHINTNLTSMFSKTLKSLTRVDRIFHLLSNEWRDGLRRSLPSILSLDHRSVSEHLYRRIFWYSILRSYSTWKWKNATTYRLIIINYNFPLYLHNVRCIHDYKKNDWMKYKVKKKKWNEIK